MKTIFMIMLAVIGNMMMPALSLADDNPKELIFKGSLNTSVLPLIAMEKGFFDDEGLNVRHDEVMVAKFAMDSVISGDADIAVLVDTNISFIGFQKRVPFKVIANQQKAYYMHVIGRKDHGVLEAKDLIGKKIAVLPATGAHFYLDKFLKKNNIRKDQIEEVYLASPLALRSAFLSGAVDATCIWEPHINFLKKNAGENISDFYDSDITVPDILVVASDDVLKNRPDDVKKFLRALIKAQEYVVEHPDDAIKIMSVKLMLEEDFLRSIWSKFVFEIVLKQDNIDLVVQGGQWIIETQKGFGNKELPDYKSFFDPSFLRDVSPDVVDIE